jgi:hypothetical protein
MKQRLIAEEPKFMVAAPTDWGKKETRDASVSSTTSTALENINNVSFVLNYLSCSPIRTLMNVLKLLTHNADAGRATSKALSVLTCIPSPAQGELGPWLTVTRSKSHLLFIYSSVVNLQTESLSTD